MCKNLQIIGSNQSGIDDCWWGWQACVVCVIIHESGFKSVACFYLMAASATSKLSLELTLSKEEDDDVGVEDPLVDSLKWQKGLSLNFESHKEILNLDCSTSIFVECTLVMFMLEPLCKICL